MGWLKLNFASIEKRARLENRMENVEKNILLWCCSWTEFGTEIAAAAIAQNPFELLRTSPQQNPPIASRCGQARCEDV